MKKIINKVLLKQLIISIVIFPLWLGFILITKNIASYMSLFLIILIVFPLVNSIISCVNYRKYIQLISNRNDIFYVNGFMQKNNFNTKSLRNHDVTIPVPLKEIKVFVNIENSYLVILPINEQITLREPIFKPIIIGNKVQKGTFNISFPNLSLGDHCLTIDMTKCKKEIKYIKIKLDNEMMSVINNLIHNYESANL